jgi:hypothetical protein
MHHSGIIFPIAERLVVRFRLLEMILCGTLCMQNIKESAQPDARHEISQLVKPMIQVRDVS